MGETHGWGKHDHLPTPKGVEHTGAKIIHLNSSCLGVECYLKRSLFISGNKFCYLKVRQLRRRRIPIVILNPPVLPGAIHGLTTSWS
jgi:hypothetical protein